MTTADVRTGFGVLLQQHRLIAGLTQEELAERAGLSQRGISDLERGKRRSPHPATVRRLAEALGLDDAARAVLLASARAAGGADAVVASRSHLAEAVGHPRHNLPVQLTSFVGRQPELDGLQHQLSTRRLLTLTGAGGVGKTRLALELARRILDRFPDGAWLVELATVPDGALVPHAVLSAIGAHEQTRELPRLAVARCLADQRMLLILDNCEHLVEACADLVDELLRKCADLSVLVTSREPLGVAGETIWPVPPLAVPAVHPRVSVETISESDAVRLFVDRARSALPGFALSVDTAPAIAQLCRGLDGIPLAIELAAPRVRVLSVQQIADRMDGALRLLATGSRGGPARHQSLRAALSWSYELLSAAERQCFRHLAVFVGGWTLDAAAEVVACDGIQKEEVLDLLASLVDKSLVLAESGGDGRMRYRFLEPLRQYADEQLAVEEAERLRTRHVDYFIHLGEQAEPHLRGGPQFVQWLDRLEPEQGNLRAALRWCIAKGEGERGLRLGGSVWRWWFERGTFQEGRIWLESLLRLAAGSARTASRAKALNGAGVLAGRLADYQAAQVAVEESRAIWTELGEPVRAGACLHNLAGIATGRGEYAAARRLYAEALSIFRDHNDRVREALTLTTFAWSLVEEGDYIAARDVSEMGIAAYRELDDRFSAVSPRMSLAWSILLSGDPPTAQAMFREELAVLSDYGNPPMDVSECLEGLAASVVADGPARQAARLLGAAARLRESVGDLDHPAGRPLIERTEATIRAALGREVFEAEAAAGREMAPSDFVAESTSPSSAEPVA